MIRRHVGATAFYLFLGVGFCFLIIFTTRNVYAELSLLGINYGDLIPFKEYWQKDSIANNIKQITFVGDVMLARHVETLMSKHGADFPYRKIELTTSDDAYVVGNFEGSIPLKHQKTPDYNLSFSVDNKYIDALRLAGFTHLSLANNHSFDYSSAGYQNTMRVLLGNNFSAFGHPTTVDQNSVVFMDLVDRKVAIIGLHTLFSKPDSNQLGEIFEFANKNSDLQIIYIHWGDEYKSKQNQDQRSLANELVDLGADLIVGHHPHVVQGIEIIEDVPVFYSLGNFVFDQYFSSTVKEGLVLDLVLDDDKITIYLKPVISRGANSQPEFMIGKEREEFFKRLARNSKKLSKEVLAGQLILP